MNTSITRSGALTPAQRAAVDSLVDRVASEDGVRPLNEAAHFALDGHTPAVHWLAHHGKELVGYAQANRDTHSVQVLVDPAHRREGVGRALSEQVRLVEKQPTWWAFGNLPGASAMAAAIGLELRRELLVMERDLVAHPVGDFDVPEGVRLRGFTTADAPAVVEVNAEAFAHHPEQGEMTLADFELRRSEPWFEADGLVLAVDDETGSLLGFHWTKVENADPNHPDEPVGEVYVIGVRDECSGRGIGRALLAAGLEHMASRGVHRVRLYVEAEQERVVRMYRSASFDEVTRDASYAG